MTRDYYAAKSIIQDYTTGGIAAKIAAQTATNLITDGSTLDGRPRITGNDLINFITFLQAYVAMVEGGVVSTLNRLNVMTLPHVNP